MGTSNVKEEGMKIEKVLVTKKTLKLLEQYCNENNIETYEEAILKMLKKEGMK
jgi:hypothetical protein